MTLRGAKSAKTPKTSPVLRAILARGVPQERIADRCVGNLEIVGHSQIARDDAVEDHAESVEPARPPRRCGAQALVHELPELRDPFAEIVFDLRRLRGRVAGAEDLPGKGVEPLGLHQCRPRRGKKIHEKFLEIRMRRCAVEAQRPGHAVLLVFKLCGVARRACHAEVSRRHGTVDDKPDRQTHRVDVVVSSRRDRDRLLLEVRDAGPGVGDAPAPRGLGLTNTASRLATLYGTDDGLVLTNGREGGLTVTVRLPFHEARA